MDVRNQWKSTFYIKRSGRSPVEETIKSLPQEEQLYIAARMERLCIENVHACSPLIGPIDSDIKELYAHHYRLLFFRDTKGCAIVYLHMFRKTTNKTPKKDKELARKRYNDFIS